MNRKFFFALAVIAMLAAVPLLGSASLRAQTIVTGAISGTVTDPSDATVVEASLTLRSAATGEVSTAVSGTEGTYQFSLLKPGTYTLTVERTGFKKTVQTVDVKVGQTVTIDVKLQIGAASTMIEVTGAAPLIQTEDANIASTFDTAAGSKRSESRKRHHLRRPNGAGHNHE